MTKKRIPIPDDVAAHVLFLSDRTCCVCRAEGKPIQIHHIDDNPANNALTNLAVLCFDCHRDTQIKGGFDRKLDAGQVRLYRDDWLLLVGSKRAGDAAAASRMIQFESLSIERATSIAEIYLERKDYELLAMHYHAIGNIALRDKYIEKVLRHNPSDSTVCFLRGLQERPDLIPEDIIERQLAARSDLQRARLLAELRRYPQAAETYATGIANTLRKGNVFSAAFYIKELAEGGVLTQLFILALREAEQEGDLWWQVRALQELGWTDKLHDLLKMHRKEIEESGNLMLQRELAATEDDPRKLLAAEQKVAAAMSRGPSVKKAKTTTSSPAAGA